MKYFAIDQGNTLTKLALIDNGQITEVKRYSDINPENLILDFLISHEITKGIVCSVRESGLKIDSAALKVLEFNRNTKLFFSLDYETPQTLGLDRIANAAGALRMSTKKDCLIVDFGTCSTYTLIIDGVLVGGAISPGLEMRYKALNTFTSGLPLVKMSSLLSENLVGKSTDESIKAGVEMAGMLEIDAMIKNYCSLYKDLNVIVTGGNLPFFESHLKSTIFAVPNLTLVGLYEIYKYNEF